MPERLKILETPNSKETPNSRDSNSRDSNSKDTKNSRDSNGQSLERPQWLNTTIPGLGSSISSPGAVYGCELDADVGDPTSEQTCNRQLKYLTDDNAANSADEDKAGQWLGVNVQSTDDFVSACAHK